VIKVGKIGKAKAPGKMRKVFNDWIQEPALLIVLQIQV
jgi:hypothetical protein